MAFNNFLFNRVTIVGVGLIGGSIGMAVKKNRLARQVIGFSQRHTSLVTATKNGAIDIASHDIKRAVSGADLVVLSTPVSTILNFLPEIAPHLKRGCIVTDVGSTKAEIVEVAERNLANCFFVGSHPLAGSEKRGATYASAELFENSLCIVTATEKTNQRAKDKIQAFWTKLGSTVKVLSPAEHDQILAYISHLPHVLAYSLIATIPTEHLAYAAQGLKDTTRIASSSPQMWNDICVANTKPLLKSLDEFVKNLAFLRKAIVSVNEKEIIEYFQKAKEKRDGIS